MRASPAALALGRCFVGSSKRVAVTLRNASAVFASLKCDLRPHPEFDLAMPNDNLSPEEYDDPRLMKVPKLGQNPFGNSALARMKAKSSKKIMASRGAEDKGGNLYKIAVAPHGSLTFDLVFSPNREAPVETFALPVFLEGVEAQPADWDARAGPHHVRRRRAEDQAREDPNARVRAPDRTQGRVPAEAARRDVHRAAQRPGRP